MKQITSFECSSLRDSDMAETTAQTLPYFRNIDVPRAVPAMLALKAAHEAFGALLRQHIATVITLELQPFARDRNIFYTDLHRAAGHALKSEDTAIRYAADCIDIVLRDYPKPSARSMNMETRVIKELIGDLKTPAMTAHVDLIPAAKLAMAQLEAANTEFSIRFDERIQEQAKHDTGGTRRARLALNAAFRDAVFTVNACAAFLDDGSLDMAINAINAVLEEARRLVHRRDGQRHRGEDGAGAPETEPAPGPAEPDPADGEIGQQ